MLEVKRSEYFIIYSYERLYLVSKYFNILLFIILYIYILYLNLCVCNYINKTFVLGVRNQFAEATDPCIVEPIKSWLRHASERYLKKNQQVFKYFETNMYI